MFVWLFELCVPSFVFIVCVFRVVLSSVFFIEFVFFSSVVVALCL